MTHFIVETLQIPIVHVLRIHPLSLFAVLECAVVHCRLFIYIDIYFCGCSHKHCQHNNKHPNHQHHYPNPWRKLSYLHASSSSLLALPLLQILPFLSWAQKAKTFSLAHSGWGRQCPPPGARPAFKSACLWGEQSRVPATRPFHRLSHSTTSPSPAHFPSLFSSPLCLAAPLPSCIPRPIRPLSTSVYVTSITWVKAADSASLKVTTPNCSQLRFNKSMNIYQNHMPASWI